jgi:hypothetical protein
MPALLPGAKARAMIVDSLARLDVEHVPLSQARTRVLAENIIARDSHPPADVSAMDGYAIRFEDVPSVPLTLVVVGESGAGHPWKGTLGIGQAVRNGSIAANPALNDLADTLLAEGGTLQLIGLCFYLCLDGLFFSIAFGGTLKLLVATLVPFDRL